MRHFLFILCIVLLIVPAVAQTETYTAPSDKAIQSLIWESNSGTTGTIDLFTANGSTIHGSWSYLPVYILGFPYANKATITIGSTTDSLDYVTPGTLYTQVSFTGKILNSTTNMAAMGCGQFLGITNLIVKAPAGDSAIIGYTISADSQITIAKRLEDRKLIEANLMPKPDEDFIAKLKGYITTLWSIFTSVIFWTKFLLVDYIGYIFIMYILGTLAIAMNKSKDIFTVLKVWIKQQEAFFNFVIKVMSAIISVITSIIQSLKPI